MTLELGDTNIPMLGEVTFFARELCQIEMEEIMQTGFTLNDIAVGKLVFAPEATSFDVMKSNNQEAFATARDERLSISRELHVEGSLLRQTVSLATNPIVVVRDPPIIVENPSPCSPLSAYGNDTCYIMKLNESDAILDTMASDSFSFYFPLIKPQYLTPGRGVKDRAFLSVRKTNELLRYDPVAFPSWCGGSASFSVWVENEGVAGYIISRYKTSEVPFPEKFWILVIGILNRGREGQKESACLGVSTRARARVLSLTHNHEIKRRHKRTQVLTERPCARRSHIQEL
jgi:hypothetical protein